MHDWPYVRSLKQACQAIEDVPSAVSHLDGDTAISRRTFDAALMAAGAVVSVGSLGGSHFFHGWLSS